MFIIVHFGEFGRSEKRVNSGEGGVKKRKLFNICDVCGMVDIIIENQSKIKQKSMKK